MKINFYNSYNEYDKIFFCISISKNTINFMINIDLKIKLYHIIKYGSRKFD